MNAVNGRSLPFASRRLTHPLVLFAILALLLLMAGWVRLAQSAQSEPTASLSSRLECSPWQVFEDPEGGLDWPQAVARPAADWRTLPEAALSPGRSASAWWLRATLTNPGERPVAAILELPWPLLDWLDVWVLEDGQVREVWHTGDRRPFASRPLDTRTFAFPLEIPPGAHREILLRTRMDNALFEPLVLRLWAPEAFWQEARHHDLWAGLYFGVLLGIGCYNLLLFLSTRERTFGLYATYLGTLVLWAAGYRGYGFELLWPEAVGWQK